jgi:hypothetical protein
MSSVTPGIVGHHSCRLSPGSSSHRGPRLQRLHCLDPHAGVQHVPSRLHGRAASEDRADSGAKDGHRAGIIRSTTGMGGRKMTPRCRRIEHSPLGRPSEDGASSFLLRGWSELLRGWCLTPDLLRGYWGRRWPAARCRRLRGQMRCPDDDSARYSSACLGPRSRSPRRSPRPSRPPKLTSTDARLPQPRRSSSVG